MAKLQRKMVAIRVAARAPPSQADPPTKGATAPVARGEDAVLEAEITELRARYALSLSRVS